MAQGNFIKRLRQGLLLYILFMVALGTWAARERSTDWDNTLRVAVFPINGDGSETAHNYIATLDASAYASIEQFFTKQIRVYGHMLDTPVRIYMRGVLDEQPPTPPTHQAALKVMYWSLKMRFWAWRMNRRDERAIRPDIKIFVRYFDPLNNARLAHSLGLQKGLLGVVNAYASRRLRGRNHVVIAHEMMHTLGATDKYDAQTTLPLHPHGYAAPAATPLHPQTRAEIMGGRIPLSATEAQIPSSLKYVVVGEATAQEIRWIRD
ncbi:MAG: hypothetical protein HKN70_04690 [Gammaproteobacteria bacterium]|nr:hypothetical protein [Gammaproteobacteria bacterium]